MNPAAVLAVAAALALVAVVAAAVALFAAWRTWQMHQQVGAWNAQVAAGIAYLRGPVELDRSSPDAAMHSAVEQGAPLFHQARDREAHLAAARAQVQADCPHTGVEPGGYCDACQLTLPGSPEPARVEVPPT